MSTYTFLPNFKQLVAPSLFNDHDESRSPARRNVHTTSQSTFHDLL